MRSSVRSRLAPPRFAFGYAWRSHADRICVAQPPEPNEACPAKPLLGRRRAADGRDRELKQTVFNDPGMTRIYSATTTSQFASQRMRVAGYLTSYRGDRSRFWILWSNLRVRNAISRILQQRPSQDGRSGAQSLLVTLDRLTTGSILRSKLVFLIMSSRVWLLSRGRVGGLRTANTDAVTFCRVCGH